MLYLKSDLQVIDYLTRDVEATVGRELALSRVASVLVDAYCGRSLSITYYLTDFELNRAGVGFIPRRPIVALAPTVLTTGIQVRPLSVNVDSSRSFLAGLSDFANSTDVTAPLYNPRTGRIALAPSGSATDYGRVSIGSAPFYQAQVEVYAGFLLDTTLTVAAPHGASSLTLGSVIGAVANVTKIQFGQNLTEYTIITVDTTTKVVTISPTLAGTLGIGTEVTQVVPEDIRLATAVIISDQLTYEPNTLRQTSTLDVLTDRLSRMNNHPIPVEAQTLLSKYRN
mgnify:CR=1 FL=1